VVEARKTSSAANISFTDTRRAVNGIPRPRAIRSTSSRVRM
jgi:hypothetical protein